MEISDELRKLVDPNNECCCEHCLSNKCKEWAKSKGFFILSGYDNTETPEAIINHIYSESGCCCDESFEAETEHLTIFKACQWILDKDT